ncbi:sensor histidine kinase [Blautia sp. An81]|uniref:sensor histidine kinase n=1 Tax=Blautia sp. An81 TaxID=1965659 RepID=UPI000B365D9E|nr:histidine kinase [Blautia sp. An81]OUN24981.1 hypothetical protein B5G33_18655 [Blautia sp. An81]
MKKIKKYFSELKLNRKLTVTMLCLIAVPLLVFIMSFFTYTNKTRINEMVSETKARMVEDYADIQKMIESVNMSTQVIMNDRQLVELLEKLNRNEEIPAEDYVEFSKEHIALLESFINSNPYLYQIRVYANNNTFPEMMPVLYHQDRLNEASWKKSPASGSWQIGYEDFLEEKQEKKLMALTSEITDFLGTKVGILEVAVGMEDMFPRMYESGNESWVGFVEKGGEIYSSGDKEKSTWEKSKESIVEEAKKTGTESYVHTKIQGKEVMIFSQPVRELSGNYILLVNIDQQIQSIIWQQGKILVIMLLLFVLLVLLIDESVSLLLRKFYDVLGVVRKIRKGNLEERIPVKGKDEMGELGIQINSMLDSIEVLMQEKLDREMLIKNTEIKALQNQINAHFIYNVLECIKMMAEIDEEFEISDAVTSLGELFRYNMKWVSGNVTIQEEIAYIKNYIQLMNLRYDFTIILSIKIPEDIYEQEIPKMSLQPIVENAICHGIVEMGEDATIYIKALRKEEEFEISITDSGIGMDEKQMDILEKKIRGEIEASGGSGNGIGLKNVQDRIKIQFGDKYGLKIHSKEGCFTKVSVLLPYKGK